LSLMAQTVAEALRESRTRQLEIRGQINALAEDDHSAKVSAWKAELSLAEKELTKARGNASKLEKRLEELDSQHHGKVALLEDAKKKLIEAEAQRDAAAEELTNSSPDGIRQRLLEAQTRRGEAELTSTKAQVTLDSGQEKGSLLSERVESFVERADEIQALMAGREKSIKTWGEELVEEKALLAVKEEERSVLLEEHEGLETERTELVERRAEVRAAATQKANNAINNRSMAEDISRSLAIKEQELANLLVEMAEMNIPVAELGAELPNVGDAERLVRDLQRRLDKFGPVNMLAIEQYDSVKQRLEEMKSDFKVLQERRKRLISITEKLESQRKTRLVSTLKAVNENFKVVYKRLSNGGRGELFLENPEEPFKGGLDMWAQPRGKSNKSRLQALSGGEKSMASLALIFAIQDHDPSPFYYFDEVDQNLDVPNSRLIAKECRNRSEAAQFIMVTLRKVSLELADHHIGITHGGDGCSRRILDFNKERAIELGAAAEKEAANAVEKNHSRIEEARIVAEDMPTVPEALPAPKSLGGLLNHIEDSEDSELEDSGFANLAERADEVSEDIEERQKIVAELLEEEAEVEEEDIEKEV